MQRHRNRHATTKHKQKTKGSSEALKVLHWANRQSRPEVMNFNVFSLFHPSIFYIINSLSKHFRSTISKLRPPHTYSSSFVASPGDAWHICIWFVCNGNEKEKVVEICFFFSRKCQDIAFRRRRNELFSAFRRKGSHQNQINKKTGSLFRSTFSSSFIFFSQFRDSPGCRRLLEIAILIVFTFRLAQHSKRLGDLGESQVRLADAPTKAVAHRAVVVRLDHRLHRVRHLIRRLIADLIVHLWRIGVCQILHSQLIIVSHRKLFSL